MWYGLNLKKKHQRTYFFLSFCVVDVPDYEQNDTW